MAGSQPSCSNDRGGRCDDNCHLLSVSIILRPQLPRVKNLIAELLSAGQLDAFSDDDDHLARLLHAIWLLRRGAMQPALHRLRRLDRWGDRELELLRVSVGSDVLLNALAEEYHNSFDGFEDARLALVMGGLLGGQAGEVKDFYQRASEFYTRVVRVAHEGRADRLRRLVPGDAVTLLWEPYNQYDSNAIAVKGKGGDLGYLRRTLAKVLVQRMHEEGVALSARVACVLGDGYPPDERLHLRVRLG